MRNFLIIWAGELISNIGSGMTAFALSIYLYQLTGSVTYVSLITLLAFMPTVLLSPVGGILADRYDRRLLMICGDALSGLGLLYIIINLKLGNQSVLPILIGVSVSSIFVSLMEPAYRATVSDLLSEDEYAKASGMVQIAGNAKYLISPAIAGVLLHISDISFILAIDFGTFIITISAVSIARTYMQKPMKKEVKQSFFKEFQEGFHVLFLNQEVRILIAIMTIICFFLGFIQTLTGPMILAMSNAKTVGFIESMSSVGMLVGSVFIGAFGIKGGQYKKVLISFAVLCGLFMALVGMQTNIICVSVMLFMFFFTLPFINSCAEVLLRVSIPNILQGRVWGLVSLLIEIEQGNELQSRYLKLEKLLLEEDNITVQSLHRIHILALDAKGKKKSIHIDSGESAGVGLQYLKGNAPKTEYEIALSKLEAEYLDKDLDDSLLLLWDNEEITLKVSGIYQDVTSGGMTAKALYPFSGVNPEHYTFMVDFHEDAQQKVLINSWRNLLGNGYSIVKMHEFISGILGGVVQQMISAACIALAIATGLTGLVILLFIKLRIARTTSQIRIQNTLGISMKLLRKQELYQILITAGLGITCGTVVANCFGEYLISIIFSIMSLGIERMHFFINPLISWIIVPLSLLIIACGFCWIAAKRMGNKMLLSHWQN